MNWYIKCFKQFADFSGRARRKEYWYFLLFNLIIGTVFGIIDILLYTEVFTTVVALVVLIPGIAVAVRRMHDIGKSGWMLLIALIPIIGAIWLLVLLATDSDPGENQYGTNPKEVTV